MYFVGYYLFVYMSTVCRQLDLAGGWRRDKDSLLRGTVDHLAEPEGGRSYADDGDGYSRSLCSLNSDGRVTGTTRPQYQQPGEQEHQIGPRGVDALQRQGGIGSGLDYDGLASARRATAALHPNPNFRVDQVTRRFFFSLFGL
jgi:hypothetical protein